MQDIPVIIFILLFFLMLILIFLHRSNKKYADKISILEQTVELKAESLSSMKEIYADSKHVLGKYKNLQKDMDTKHTEVLKLGDTKSTLEEMVSTQKREMQQQTINHESIIQNVTQKIFSIEKLAAEKDSIIHEMTEKNRQNKEESKKTVNEKRAAYDRLEQTHLKSLKESSEKIEEKDTKIVELKALLDKNEYAHDNEKKLHIEQRKEQEHKYKQYVIKVNEEEITYKSSMEKLNSEYQNQIEQADNAGVKINALEQDARDLKSSLASLKAIHEEDTLKIKEQKLQLKEMLSNEQEDFAKYKGHSQEEKKKLEEYNKSQAQDIEDYKIQISKLNKVNTDILQEKNEAISIYKNEEKNTLEKIETLEEMLEEKENSLSDMKLVNVDVEKKILLMSDTMEENKHNNEEKVLQLSEELGKEKDRFDYLQKLHVTESEEAKEVQKTLEEEIEQKDKVMDELQNLHENTKKENEESITSLEEELKSRHKTIEALNKRREELVNETSKSINDLEDEVKEKALSIENMHEIYKIEILKYKEEKNILNNTHAEDKETIAQLNKSLEELALSSKLGIQELNEIQAEVEKQTLAKIKTLEESIKNKEEGVEKTLKSLEAVEEAIHQKENRIEELEKNFSAANSTIDEMYQDAEVRSKKAEDEIRELGSQLQNEKEQVLAVQNEKVNLEKRLAAQEIAMDELKKAKEEQAQDNEVDVIILNKNIANKDKTILELNEMQEEISVETQSTIAELKNSVTKKDEAIEVLKDETNKLNEDMVFMKEEMTTKEESAVSLSKSMHSLEEQFAEKVTQIEQMHTLQEHTNSEVTEYKNTLEETIKEQRETIRNLNDEYEDALRKAIDDTYKLKKQLENKEKSISKLNLDHELLDSLISQTDVMRYIHDGESKEDVAKKFGIPIKRVELIIKFDKIKGNRSTS